MITFFLLACALQAAPPPASIPALDQIQLTKIDGQPLPALSGKAVLVVNVASQCGFTPQYDGLQALYAKYKDRGLEVLGVPCNQFGDQEPGSAQEIQSFCRLNYGVEFPILEKQEVNGPGRSPLYTALVWSDVGKGSDVKWNFEKFVVDPKGMVTARFRSNTTPDDPDLIKAIEAVLPR